MKNVGRHERSEARHLSRQDNIRQENVHCPYKLHPCNVNIDLQLQI